MLPRVLEPEVMDSPEEACDYDAMDHRAVNERFVEDFLQLRRAGLREHPERDGVILDVGTGTAQIPILLCQRRPKVEVVAIDYAEHMLKVAAQNVEKTRLQDRIRLHRCDAKKMPFPDSAFAAVMSNSIVHHIPEPRRVLAEMIRVVQPGGVLFVRDLLRPKDNAEVRRLVSTYAGDANAHQRQMFEDSLRAALTLAEIRSLVEAHGYLAESVQQSSDRHWTWVGRK